MKKILALLVLLLPVHGYAAALSEYEPEKTVVEEVPEPNLTLNVRRISLELSKTEVQNTAEYINSPLQQLRADSQDFMKGVADVALEYKKNRLFWDNGVFMEYGKTTIQPHNAPKTYNENADRFLASSYLTYAAWEASGFNFGPIARVQYETEFTENLGTPRLNVVRSNAGVSLFNHSIIKSFYLTGVYEYDFTHAENEISKLAAELGWRLEYELREGVSFSTNGYYRKFLSYSHYLGTDLESDLNIIARMDTNLWGDFTMGPYVQYRRALSREADVYGSNTMVGISFNYITKFGLR